jgi:uncharacterized membrane protein YczE
MNMLQEIKPQQVGVRFGLMVGIGSILLHLILFVTHWYVDYSRIDYLDNIIMLIGFILACNAFKKGYYNTMTFKQGFEVGAWSILISSFITATFIFIYIKFIDHTLLEALRDEEMRDIASQKLTDEQFKKLMDNMHVFMSPWFIAGVRLVRGLGIGIILAAVVATLLKKEP